jgi:outer membrane protein
MTVRLLNITRQQRLRSTGACALLVAACNAALAQDALLRSGRDLLSAKKPDQAYVLLAAQEALRAGSPEFDYLLGIAASDAGHHTRAIFSLERVLAVQPTNALARAELARVYLKAGEVDAARSQLAQVNTADIPEQARESVNRLLSAINAPLAPAADQRTLRAYLEVGITRDTNLNNGPVDNQFAVPLFGGLVFDVNTANQHVADSVGHIGAGVTLKHSISIKTDLVGAINVRRRTPRQQKQFASELIDGNIGVSYKSGVDQFSGTLNFGSSSTDEQRARNVSGLSAQWLRSVGDNAQLGLFAQYSHNRYPGQDLRNTNRLLLGGTYGAELNPQTSAYISMTLGSESTTHEDVDYFGHRFASLRTGGLYAMASGTKLYTNISVEQRRYSGEDPFFLIDRRDRQLDASVGMRLALANKSWGEWHLVPQIGYTKNSSNIAINNYTRSTADITARLDF